MAIREEYNMDEIAHIGYVYARINKAWWYGLEESGK